MATELSICLAAMANLGGRQNFALGDTSAEARACETYFDMALDNVLGEADWSFATQHTALDGCYTMQEWDDTTFDAAADVSEELTLVDAAIEWTYTTTGFTGRVYLQKSTDDGVTWSNTTTETTALTASTTAVTAMVNLTTYAKYRWYCTARSAGSIVIAAHMLGTDRYAYQYHIPSDCVLPRFLTISPFHGRRMPPMRIPFEVADNGNGVTVLYTDNSGANDGLDEPAELVLCYTQRVAIALLPQWFVLCLTHQLSFLSAMAVTRKKEIKDDSEKDYIKSFNSAWARDPNSQTNEKEYFGESNDARM